MTDSQYKHWRIESDQDGVCWLTIDRAGESQNSLSQEVMTELELIVGQLEKEPPRGLILQSGKKESFIVGADVREFEQVESVEEAEQFIREAHKLFNRIENLSFPTAVAIDGYCLGGGLELALCFDYIVARNTEKTRIGYPEVKLAIYPGFGGSAPTPQRPRGRRNVPLPRGPGGPPKPPARAGGSHAPAGTPGPTRTRLPDRRST